MNPLPSWALAVSIGAIITGADGRPWVDLLTSSPGYSFGQVVSVEVLQ